MIYLTDYSNKKNDLTNCGIGVLFSLGAIFDLTNISNKKKYCLTNCGIRLLFSLVIWLIFLTSPNILMGPNFHLFRFWDVIFTVSIFGMWFSLFPFPPPHSHRHISTKKMARAHTMYLYRTYLLHFISKNCHLLHSITLQKPKTAPLQKLHTPIASPLPPSDARIVRN